MTIERNGYETIRSTVVSGVDGEGAAGMAGNVIFGGIIGAGIDAGTGAMHSHKPNPLQVTLVPVGTTPADTETMESVEASDEGAAEPTDPEPAESPAGEALEETAEELADGEPSE